MTTRSAPRRHWFSYGTDPLPTGPEAMGEPFAAFPSWFLRIERDRLRQGADSQRCARPVAGPQLARHHRPSDASSERNIHTSPSPTRSNFAKRPTERNWPDRPDFSVLSTGLSPTYPPCSEQNGASTTGRRVWRHITTTPVGGGLPAPLSAVNFLGSRVLHLMVVCRR